MLAAVILYLIAALGSNTYVKCFVINANMPNDVDNLNNTIELRLMEEFPDYNDVDMERMQIIFPGTKWCGTGNIAAFDDDYGTFEQPDRCCKAHDHCPEFLDEGQSRYGLTNTAQLSRLDCSCELQFYNCLKNSGTMVANKIGFMYFNLLVPACYKEDFPIKQCLQLDSGYFRNRCGAYELDTTKPKAWQFFDLPTYW